MHTWLRESSLLLAFLTMCVVAASANAQTFSYDLDIVFASNINDPSDVCSKYDRTGCDLWMATATLDLDAGTLVINDLESLKDTTTYGEWDPALLVIDKDDDENLIYYTRFHQGGGGTEELKNDIAAFTVDSDDWSMSNLLFPGPSSTLDEAQFPSLSDSGDFVAYTYLDNNQKNVRRSSLDSNFKMTSFYTVYSTAQGGTCVNVASDPAFVRDSEASLVFHCPSGNDEAKLARKTPRGIVDHTENDVTDGCGHFATTMDGDWAACSKSGNGAVYYYDVTNYPIFPHLKTVASDRLLINQDEAFYDDYYADYASCDEDLKQTLISFGDSSQWVLYTVTCESQAASKLFFVNADPDNPAQNGAIDSDDLFYLSGELQDYIDDHAQELGVDEDDIEDLDFCSGDFDMYSLF